MEIASKNLTLGKVYTGASGLVLPVPNKRLYPANFQDKSRLCYYSSLFNSLEINSSFYKLPMASTVKKWVENVPADFRFTFKLWKQITHNKPFTFNPQDVELFFSRIEPAEDKNGCVLVQFPPSLTIKNIKELQYLLNIIAEFNRGQWNIALEFRDRSWYQPAVMDLLEEHKGSLVIHDIPASATPLPDTPSDIVYLRFHGPNGGYRGSYSDAHLYEYASYVKEWKAEGKEIYVYFNNTMGDAVNNLISFNGFLIESS